MGCEELLKDRFAVVCRLGHLDELVSEDHEDCGGHAANLWHAWQKLQAVFRPHRQASEATVSVYAAPTVGNAAIVRIRLRRCRSQTSGFTQL